MSKLIHEDLTYAIRGILFDVHNQLGPALREELYRDAVAIGLETKGITCRTEKSFEVFYRDQRVGLYYIDIWVEGGKVLLELKVAPEITAMHQAQALSYLKVTDADLALVVNFGTKSLETERLPNFLRDKQADFVWETRLVDIDVPHPDLTNHLLEVCHRVHFELGPGFLHQVYRRATMVELQYQDMQYEYIKKIPIRYQEQLIGMQDVRLILVANKILLATVAVKQIDETMKMQLRNRLKHLGFPLGLLVNFNHTSPEVVTVR